MKEYKAIAGTRFVQLVAHSRDRLAHWQPDQRDVEWVYEIDLAHLVFFIDNRPVFRLDGMPRTYVEFLKYTSHDGFGLKAYCRTTPMELMNMTRAGFGIGLSRAKSTKFLTLRMFGSNDATATLKFTLQAI